MCGKGRLLIRIKITVMRNKMLRFAEFGIDEAYLGGGEGVTADGCERTKAGIERQPVAQLLPCALLGEVGEIETSQFRAAVSVCLLWIVVCHC